MPNVALLPVVIADDKQVFTYIEENFRRISNALRLVTSGESGGGSHPDLAAHDALGLATDSELTGHANDTTSVHGISDTAALATDAEVATAVTNHEAAANPHPSYATDADLTAHAGASDPHPVYATDADLAAYATDSDLAAHVGAADPHTGYATDADLTAHAGAADPHPTYHTAAEVAADIATHAGAVDPHTGYATDTDLTTHAGAADPHTGYQKESEKAAASGYASLDAGTKVPTDQLGSGSASATTYLRGDQTWATPAGGGGGGGETDPIVWIGGF